MLPAVAVSGGVICDDEAPKDAAEKQLEISWFSNYEEGLKTAKEQWKPVLLYFGSKM